MNNLLLVSEQDAVTKTPEPEETCSTCKFEDEELNTLSAVNQGVSSRQIEIEQEQQRQMAQEMAPFDANVVMQTPAANLPTSPSVQSAMEEHDVLF